MAVKKELAEFLHVFHQITIPELLAKGYKPTPVNSREALANLTGAMVTEIVEVPQIYDDIVPARGYCVPVRIYNPNPAEALPVLMNFHGGGFMVGSVSVYDALSRKLAMRTQHIVAAVEYRLAPECPYPAGMIDGYNATRHIWSVLDARGIRHRRELSMFGDSAGGGMCAYIAARAQHDRDMDIKSQILLYPGLDFTMGTESMRQLGNNYFLTTTRIRYYYENLFQHNEDRYAESPLHGFFGKGMPPTLVITAGYDPLKDEGRLYAEKTQAAGVPTEYVCMENMIHAFMNMEKLAAEETETLYALVRKFLEKTWQ
ncbi:MAG: alpha/beta hydrolase [Deltaproteobacteria bacterium]|nr:alpha/beta hydrolase [Deltaproteobacteria bacterium]